MENKVIQAYESFGMDRLVILENGEHKEYIRFHDGRGQWRTHGGVGKDDQDKLTELFKKHGK